MKIEIEIKAGPDGRDHVVKADIKKNMSALSRAIEDKQLAGDFVLLTDTLSILEGIHDKLPIR